MISNFSFSEESVNRNSIIMISKEYHYVINLGITSNFNVSINHAYPGFFVGGSVVAAEGSIVA